VRKGADFIIVLTNDAWYPRSSEPEQHFSHAVFRAVENRRRIVRCGNNSFSCVISPIGVVEDSVTHGVDPKTGNMITAPSKKSRGYAVFKVEVPYPQKQSFYTRHGDVFILACSLLLTLSCVQIFWKWKTTREYIQDAFRT
jgi:apolipoprotein N-acyltransferase